MVSGLLLFPNILPDALGSRAWEGGAVGMRLCPVLTKDNKGRKGLAWCRLPSLPALSSFTGP